jgi:hypothetical protein
MYVNDRGTQDNVIFFLMLVEIRIISEAFLIFFLNKIFSLSSDLLKKRQVVMIDIANDKVAAKVNL